MSTQAELSKAALMLINKEPITKVSLIAKEQIDNQSIVIANSKFDEENFKQLLSNTSWPLAKAKDLYKTYGDRISQQEKAHLMQVDKMQRSILTEIIPAIKSINSLSGRSLGYTYAHIIDEKEIEYDTEDNVDIVDILTDATYKVYALANGHIFNGTIDSNNVIEFKNTFKAKELILEIDKQNTKPFNQINIKTERIEKIIIGTSTDGIEFRYSTYKQKAIYSSSISLEEKTDRFIRIIFIQKDIIPMEAGKFVHRIKLNEISIGMKAQKELLSFSTPEYIINKTCSYVGLQDKVIGKGVIKYEASINGREFTDISDVNIAINEFFENKLIALDNTTILEPELIATNEIMIFDATRMWTEDSIGMYGWFKFNDDVTLETGTNKIIINGIIQSGTILIVKGIHKIHIINDNFINYFNEKQINKIVYNDNIMTGTDFLGGTHSVTDAMYPYNTKYLVELNGIKLGKLIEDTVLQKADEGYKIGANDTKAYNLAFRSTIGTLNTIKIKGTINNVGQIEPTTIKNIFVNII